MKDWRQPQEIQKERKESRRMSETPQGMWLGGAQKDSLWLCYAGPLAEKDPLKKVLEKRYLKKVLRRSYEKGRHPFVRDC